MFVTYIYFCQLSFSGRPTLLQLRDLNSISIGVKLQINLALSYCYESEKKIYHVSIHGRALGATVTPSSSLTSDRTMAVHWTVTRE